MRNPRYFNSSLIALASAALATFFLIACQQSQQQPAPAATQPAAAPTKEVYVVFEGPWAFAADPKDANSVIALAPKTKSHRDLIVQTWDKTLASGIYDLSLPARSGPAAGTVDPNILQAKIDPQSVQHVLDRKSERYAIRLPRPEAYGARTHYRVPALTGCARAGSPDGGPFNPWLLRVDPQTKNFLIEPAHDPDPADK